MPLPLRHLPGLQKWDCQCCAQGCRQYRVYLTEEERQRIAAMDWTGTDLAGQPLILREGMPWAPRYYLRQREDNTCVFLSDKGLCRIHERFGSEAKPFPCRLYPFILVPAGDHWRVGMRFSCPAVASNQGRPLPEHETELRDYVTRLEQREGMAGKEVPPPPLQGRQRVAWPDLLLFLQAILTLLRNREDRLERRWRKCLALAKLCREARFDQLTGSRLVEFLNLLGPAVEADVAVEPADVPPPTWVGRVLFRPLLAILVRKDMGPDRGIAARGKLALLGAAWRFARGAGPVPQLHARIPVTTFEAIEQPTGPLPPEAELALERYYLIKAGSLQFCGPTNFNLAFWTGLESLALTMPAILWLARALHDLPRGEAVTQAMAIVDNNFGYHPLLGSRRSRFSLDTLASWGELGKLIAWYSR